MTSCTKSQQGGGFNYRPSHIHCGIDRKTLTGSLDPTCANGTNKPCKLKVPRSAQIFIGGGGVLQATILEILEWGNSRNFEPKFLATGMCSASQIVSHILRMWGFMIQKILLDFQNFTNDLCLGKILSNFDFFGFFWPSLFASEIVHFDTFYNFQIATEAMN